jgi:hypothetical protein
MGMTRRSHEDEGRQLVVRETNLAAFCGPTSSGLLTSFYDMEGKQYVPKQIKHSIMPMKQS